MIRWRVRETAIALGLGNRMPELRWVRIPPVTIYCAPTLDAAPTLACKLATFPVLGIDKQTGILVAYKNHIAHDFNKPFPATVPQIGFCSLAPQSSFPAYRALATPLFLSLKSTPYDNQMTRIRPILQTVSTNRSDDLSLAHCKPLDGDLTRDSLQFLTAVENAE